MGPKALDDGSDGWWAGAQRCFVTIPLALALSASLAYGAQQQADEVVPQPAAVALADADPQVWSPPWQRPSTTVFLADDELPRVQAAEEDSAPAWFLAPSPIRPVPSRAFTADDEFVPTPATAALDDGDWPVPVFVTESRYISLWGSSAVAITPAPLAPPDDAAWQVPGPPRILPVVGVFLSDDEVPPQAVATAFGQDDPPVWTAPFLPPSLTVFRSDDELPRIQAAEEDPAPTWAPSAPFVRLAVFTADDEILPRALGGDGEAWSPPTTVQTPVQLSLPWQDDEAPAGALYGQAEEYLWQVFTPPWPAARPLYLPDPEEIPVGALFGVPEDTPWQVSTPTWAPPSVLFLPDPEELPAGALYGPPEDAPWVLPAIPQPRPIVPLWVVPDELATVSAADEDGWQPLQSALSRIALAFPWAASDEIVPQPIVSADDDAPVPLAPPPRLSTAVWWADEEIIPTVVTLTVDDEVGWQAPVVWELPPRPALLPTWAGDDETVTPPAPLTVDDDVWQILLPAQEWLEVSVWW